MVLIFSFRLVFVFDIFFSILFSLPTLKQEQQKMGLFFVLNQKRERLPFWYPNPKKSPPKKRDTHIKIMS